MNHDEKTRDALRTHLQFAVPLRVWELQQHGGATEQDIEQARADAAVLGPCGDHLLFGGSRAAECLWGVVNGCAVLAFCPGGITLDYLGLHFEAPQP